MAKKKRSKVAREDAKQPARKQAAFVCRVETSKYGNPYLQFSQPDEHGYLQRFAAINSRQAKMALLFPEELRKLAETSQNGE